MALASFGFDACTCSGHQLEQVGCDCIVTNDAKIVRVFKDGYASDNQAKVIIAGGLDVGAEVRKRFGSFARAFEVRPFIKPVKPFKRITAEYAREMSQHDNS